VRLLPLPAYSPELGAGGGSGGFGQGCHCQ
jgi:hypothetical protein